MTGDIYGTASSLRAPQQLRYKTCRTKMLIWLVFCHPQADLSTRINGSNGFSGASPISCPHVSKEGGPLLPHIALFTLEHSSLRILECKQCQCSCYGTGMWPSCLLLIACRCQAARWFGAGPVWRLAYTTSLSSVASTWPCWPSSWAWASSNTSLVSSLAPITTTSMTTPLISLIWSSQV